MKISYNWLKEFTKIEQYTPTQLADILLSIGFEVTEIIKTFPDGSDKIFSAKIIEVKKHPNADNLSLCRLTDGKTEYNVICGAKNVYKGIIVPLAMPGSILPAGTQIKISSIRGIKSEGMICSSKELGIDEESGTIMHLALDTPLGEPVSKLLGLEDYILNLEVHANRPDCLGHLGVAREIATKLGISMHHLKIHSTEKLSGEFFPVEILSPDKCQRYIACVLNNLKVGESPSFIKGRLKNCGLRPINNVVDITNYVLIEFGHPLHTFDFEKISGSKICVRNAKEGESLQALDGRIYKLDPETLVIADEQKPLALAGIIGGADTAVTQSTKNILLESALFSATNIRRSRIRHQIVTESSYRFERALSWEICQLASQRTIQLLIDICGANYTTKTDIKTTELKRNKIFFHPERAEAILSLKVEKKEIAEILTRQGMTVTPQAEYLAVEIPSWRQDIDEEIDLIEEIARHKGYDKIPADDTAIISLDIEISDKEKIEEKIRNILKSGGFSEALNYSLISENSSVMLENPISQEFKYLRTNLISGLLSNVARNVNNQNENIRLFEFGKVYSGKENNFEEENRLGLICCGDITSQHWNYKKQPADFFFLSGVIDAVMDELKITGVKNSGIKIFSDVFHPGKSASKKIKNEIIICEYGMLKPDIISDIKYEVYYAEFFLKNILSNVNLQTMYQPYLSLPRLKRDISIVAPKGVPYEMILNEILKSEEKEISIDALLFDIYEGENIQEDKRSLGIRLTFIPQKK
ncbi:MAG: phenylalanine--tRNA ligase subunit beta, partial [Elusimicrobiota bacterium]